MELVKSVAREIVKGIGNKSREFYEFVLPPVDMHLGDSELTVVIDIPGFKKDEIKLSIAENILSISAKKPDDGDARGRAIYDQRPRIIDKKILLPVPIEEKKEITAAKYADGILTLVFPLVKNDRDIRIE